LRKGRTARRAEAERKRGGRPRRRAARPLRPRAASGRVPRGGYRLKSSAGREDRVRRELARRAASSSGRFAQASGAIPQGDCWRPRTAMVNVYLGTSSWLIWRRFGAGSKCDEERFSFALARLLCSKRSLNQYSGLTAGISAATDFDRHETVLLPYEKLHRR
jgi:hypothetical protein